MHDVQKYFEDNNYVFLPGFIQEESCVELTNELKRFVEEGKSRKDTQCPISEAIRDVPVFDSLLEQLLPKVEYATGKKLYPTYAYARLYAPGDVLKPHIDRPACEISATLTLGFEGEPWPIFVGDESTDGSGRQITFEHNEVKHVINERKVVMQPGDAIVYYGTKKSHWREQYTEGKWQAQVFLHYVDANGPYACEKYDRRECLSHHEQAVEGPMRCWVLKDALSLQSCQSVIATVEKNLKGVPGLIGGGEGGDLNKRIRDVERIDLPFHKGIGATLTGIGFAANFEAWNFDINRSNQCDYLKYDKDGHYCAHIDTFLTKNSKECRKLTVLAFLNDDFEGGRLYLQDGEEKYYPPQEPGTVIVFPSFMLHGVEPVTKGVRRSIVTWLVGPWFK